MILKQAERDRIMIVCERLEDGSRFMHYTATTVEALRMLRALGVGFYRPLYLVRVKQKSHT